MNVTLPALARIAEIESRFGAPPATSEQGFAQVLTETEQAATPGGVLPTPPPATAVERASNLLQSTPLASIIPAAVATPLSVGAALPTVVPDAPDGVPATVPFAAVKVAA